MAGEMFNRVMRSKPRVMKSKVRVMRSKVGVMRLGMTVMTFCGSAKSLQTSRKVSQANFLKTLMCRHFDKVKSPNFLEVFNDLGASPDVQQF